MVRHFFLNLLICGCLFTACGGGSSSSSSSVSSEMSVSEDGVTVIPMNARPGDVLNLSDFAESIELIPLETTDDCLIGWMPEIIATEKFYYMISAVGYDFQKLYVFDKQGKFVRQISGRGQGGDLRSGARCRRSGGAASRGRRGSGALRRACGGAGGSCRIPGREVWCTRQSSGAACGCGIGCLTGRTPSWLRCAGCSSPCALHRWQGG